MPSPSTRIHNIKLLLAESQRGLSELTSRRSRLQATEEEKRPPGSFGTPGRDPAVAEQVQQRVAEMIRQHEQEAGDAKRFMETLKADALRKRNATYAALTKEEA